MKRLTIDQRRVKLVNAQEYETGTDGVIPLRFPAAVISQMSDAMPGIARMATGVEVQVQGKITEIDFYLRVLDSDGFGFYAELYRGDAKLLPTWRLDPQSRDIQVGCFSVTGCLHGSAPLRLLLPTHCTIEVIAVEVDEAAVVEDDFIPFDYRALPGSSGLTWGVYGDSIAQGANVICPSSTWIDLTAHTLKLKPINLAIGGYGVAEAPVASHLATRTDFDILSLHMGANCLDDEEFIDQYSAFLQAIRDAQPTLPIIMATPIIGGTVDYEPGQIIQRVHAAITQVYDTRISAGDAHLHLIDGLSLLPDTSGLNADGVHLHEYGAMRIAEHLVPRMQAILCREFACRCPSVQ